MALGQDSPLSGSSIAQTVATKAITYAAQYGAEMMGYAMYATPIGIVIGFIIQFFQQVIIGKKQPVTPSYRLGVALPLEQVPTVGTTLLAGTHFKLLSQGDTTIPPEGALVLAVDFGDFPQVADAVKKAEPQVAEFQQKMLTPFFITIGNLTPERQVSMVNTLMKPPLWATGEDFFYSRGLSKAYHVYPFGTGEIGQYGFDGLANYYQYFVTTLNDAFLRRIYRSVLDSPALTPEQYGEVVGTAPAPSIETGGNTDSQIGVPTELLPSSSSPSSLLPILVIAGAVLAFNKR